MSEDPPDATDGPSSGNAGAEPSRSPSGENAPEENAPEENAPEENAPGENAPGETATPGRRIRSAPSSATSFGRSVPREASTRTGWRTWLHDAWRSLSPAQLFVSAFLLLIGLGTAGFKVLPGLYTGPELSWLDALFTATSAVCVTGLIVVDTATYFTTWGQAYILLLIQLGGLGIISFTSIIIVALGQRFSLRHEVMATGPAEIVPEIDYRDLTWAVFRFTLAIEAAGAVLLYLCWVPELGWGPAAWTAVFHSVSAFCNAGFSTFTTSLMGFQHNVPLLLVTMVLIVVGGIGFLTLEEIVLWKRAGGTDDTPRNEASRRKTDRQDANRPNTRLGDRGAAGRPLTGRSSPGGERRFRLSVHSQIVLVTTAVLIVAGWVLFTVFEWGNTLSGMPAWARLANGLFASVTTRTAGFNTIDYASAYADTNFLTILFMSIGGSPGSTAGGLKTTTFALLGLVAWARLRGHATVSVSGRSIPEETIQKAIGLFVVGFGIVTAAIYGFSIVELKGLVVDASHGSFLAMMFEAVSAFNTVGLSMGVTGELTVPGRWMTVVLMFIGRVGPLTVAAAMSRQRKNLVGGFRYAYEDVAVG